MANPNALTLDISKGYDKQARALVGKRVEIPVHYDMWMRGARFGVVTSHSVKLRCVRVKLDHPQARRLLRVWYADMDYMKEV